MATGTLPGGLACHCAPLLGGGGGREGGLLICRTCDGMVHLAPGRTWTTEGCVHYIYTPAQLHPT